MALFRALQEAPQLIRKMPGFGITQTQVWSLTLPLAHRDLGQVTSSLLRIRFLLVQPDDRPYLTRWCGDLVRSPSESACSDATMAFLVQP